MVDSNNQPTSEIAGLLHSFLRRLKEEREKLNAEISTVESQLAGLSSVPSNGQQAAIRRRRPRGANLESVRELLVMNPREKFSVSDIKAKAGIMGSSVRTAIEKLQSEHAIEEVSKGYWRVASTT